MTAEEALRRLSLIAKGETGKLRALAQEISADSKRPTDALANLWSYAGGRDLKKVEVVLEELGLPGVPALLALRKPAPAARASLQAARALSTTQGRIAARLRQMLDSRLPMPPSPSAGQAEEREPQSRECDEAYLMARQLLKGDDSDRERFRMRRTFLLMPEAERDAEIAKYQSSGWWSALMEDEE